MATSSGPHIVAKTTADVSSVDCCISGGYGSSRQTWRAQNSALASQYPGSSVSPVCMRVPQDRRGLGREGFDQARELRRWKLAEQIVDASINVRSEPG